MAGACGVVVLGFVRAAAIGFTSRAAVPLPVYGNVPAFSLTTHEARVLTADDLKGRVWIADFIFTSCAGQCLLMSDTMRALQRAFPTDQDLAFVSFSVDPAHDTSEVLSAYVLRYGADPRWTLLTGTREALYRLCHDGFQLAMEEDPTSTREPIIHSVRLVLIDQRGTIRGYYDATNAKATARLRQDVRRLLRHDG